MAFLIDVPGPEGEDVQEPQTFSDLVSDIWGTSSIYGDASSYEQNFDRALYTVHFIHHRDPDHWTVIVRESETGHLWHFDSGGGEDERERRLNGAIDRLTTWLRRCNKQIPETSEAFNVSVTEQTQHWECSLHSIANAMAFLRFGILGWDKLKCIALETDADPVPPARSVNADKLRTTMKRSLHGLWGLMMKEDVASVNEQVEQAERENDPEYLKALGDESQMIRQEKAMNELKEIVFKPQTQDSLKELERKARENREEKRKEKEAREAREKEEEEKKKAQEQRDKEAEEELVELAKQMEDELKATQDDSLIDKANMSFDKVIDAVTNNPDELNSLNEQERKAREAREKKRKEQLEKDQREIKERFRRAQAERERRAQARKAREEREKEEEKERERKAQEARDKEQQEKLNQQQGASNSRKRGAADDDDDDDESSGRSSKRSKQTPEENPTENLPQSPNNKRKTPPPDTEPKPAKRARREPTPAPKAPVRQSERQRKATQKAAEAVQETEAAQGAEAAQEAEAAEESEDAVVEPDWREARRARLRAMGMTRLIEECKRRLLAGPGDEHKPLPYSAYKTIDGLVERLMWYDEPEGYEEDLEGKSLKELKEMCKETYKLYYGGTKVGLMKERLRWFYAEQQRHVQTLIEDGEIPANWNGEEVVEEEEDLFGDDEVENGEEEEEDEDISEEP
ncbi:hypothetical protein N0V85_005166 [Neurospora sp. IMI 360204]|nr:hypothetical protein N0V85_005166 [Neurospora sp. IMI 360204]